MEEEDMRQRMLLLRDLRLTFGCKRCCMQSTRSRGGGGNADLTPAPHGCHRHARPLPFPHFPPHPRRPSMTRRALRASWRQLGAVTDQWLATTAGSTSVTC